MLEEATREQFGKDHWSTLAYVETCCVDQRGVLSRRRMRCNINGHSLLAGHLYGPNEWKPEYGTRLKDGTILPEHDDWDCLNDLEREGFVMVLSLINGFTQMTDEGNKVVAQIRKHKGEGGNFSTFEEGRE